MDGGFVTAYDTKTGKDVYVQYGAGVRDARLSAARLESLLGVAGTHRNWRTVSALAELAAQA